jgi:uncharacterized RDD family membrane protein YckC
METTLPPVQSPPQVRQIALASRGSRLLAFIVDLAALLAIWLIGIFLNEPFVFLIGLGAYIIWQIRWLSSYGQSIGKKVMNIKIVKIDTEENGGLVPNVLLRWFVNNIIGFIPLYVLVDVLFIFREDQRCIHDMIAGTKVVEA